VGGSQDLGPDAQGSERDDDHDDGSLIAPQSRRRFLALMAGGVGATFISPAELAQAAEHRVSMGAAPSTFVFDFWSVQFTRTKDLVDLTFWFKNLEVSTRGGRHLVKANSDKPSYIVIEFPPQHVAEEAMFYFPGSASAFAPKPEGVPTATAPYGVSTKVPGYGNTPPQNYLWHRAMPLKSRFANPSRLAFEVNPSVDFLIPYTESGLFDWSNPAFTPALVEQADNGAVWEQAFVGYFWNKKPLAAPTNWQTAIEFPYGLVITPSSAGVWRHNSAPVTRNKRTEVWSTSLRHPWYRYNEPQPKYEFTIDTRDRDGELRAIWTRDPQMLNDWGEEYDPNPDHVPASINPPSPQVDPPFVTLPGRSDKWKLVGQQTYSTSFLSPAPAPMTARKFRMSSLGATVDMSGAWESHTENDEHLDLVGYVHRSFAGRDFYVKVVIEGYLYPTLHRAAKVSVMERLFVQPPGLGAVTGPVAYLQEWIFLVTRERTRTYGGSDAYGRGFPFTKVVIDTESTPPILPTAIPGTGYGDAAFFPVVGDDIFRFSCTVTDQIGQVHKVDIPLAFIEAGVADDSSFDAGAFADKYEAYPKPGYRTIKLDGQRIGFAPDFDPSALGKTNLPTFSITMRGPSFDAYDGPAGGKFSVSLLDGISFPRLQFAGVTIDSLGGLAGAGKMFAFEFPSLYLQSGFGGDNALAKIFARFVDLGSLPSFDFAGLKAALKLPDLGSLGITFPDVSKIGGLVSPNFDLSGLSAALGTFGGAFPDFGLPDILGTGGGFKFDPASWFSGLPKLFGGIDLVDILSKFGFGSGDDAPDTGMDLDFPKIPGLTTEVIYKDVLGQKVPVGMTIRYRWCTDKLQNWPEDSPIFEHHFEADGEGAKAEFCLQVRITVQYAAEDLLALPDPSKIEAAVEGQAELTNFRINLIGSGAYKFITLQFSSMRFTARTGADPKVDPSIASVDFSGALKYLMKLKDYLLPEGGLFGKKEPDSGKSSGLKFTPIFDLDSKHVAVGFDLGIPTIAVGVFSLSNLEVGMLVTLPFNSDPLTVAFHVCRKDKPFLLTVGIFGGGGFFAMELGTSGVRSLEISLEFGAAAQLDVGVASGSVSVMGGIYFAIKTDPTEQLELTGYVRLNGRLEVLGIITISVEFLLSLTYLEPPGSAKGRAEVTVTVEVAFFSTSVSMSVEKEFGGNSTGSGPTPKGKVGPAVAPVDQPVRYADLMTWIDYSDYVDAFA